MLRVQGTWSIEALRLVFPNIISHHPLKQLRQLVDKLDLFWDTTPDSSPLLESNGFGTPQGGGVGSKGSGRDCHSQRGLLWDLYPVTNVRVNEVSAGGGGEGPADSGAGNMKRRREDLDNQLWAMRSEMRDARLMPRGGRVNLGNDSDLIQKVKERLRDARVTLLF
jgi:hypothetical protein